MKNILIGLITAIILIIVTAATTVNIMTVKPARPVSVICIPDIRNSEVDAYVIKYAKQGYVVKNFYPGAYYDYDGLLILEKY